MVASGIFSISQSELLESHIVTALCRGIKLKTLRASSNPSYNVFHHRVDTVR
jgi:hypothetical protein